MSSTTYRFIRVTTMIENFVGKRIHHAHCIPIDDHKELNKGMQDLVEWCTKHVPLFMSAELVEVGEGQTKPEK